MEYNYGMKTKKVTVTMPIEVIQAVKQMADKEGRSFSGLVSHLVSEGAKNKAA